MPDDPDETPTEETPRSAGAEMLRTIGVVVAAVAIVVFVQALVVKPFKIPSGSMERTLHVGQRVIVDRVSLHLRDPHRGDIVVFHPPVNAEDGGMCRQQPDGGACVRGADERTSTYFIKRVVAVGGDRVSVRDGRLTVNGQRVREPYARVSDPDCDTCDLPEEITVPAGSYYMVGDNRADSYDSRAWGAVPRDWLVGVARARYWPPGDVGGL